MKLFFCAVCGDVQALRPKVRVCQCEQSGGRYLPDGVNAEVYGEAVALGFANLSLLDAVRTRPRTGLGKPFTAFAIPLACTSVQSFPEKNPIAMIRIVGRKGRRKGEGVSRE